MPPVSSLSALQSLYGVSPLQVPYTPEELAEAHAEQQQDYQNQEAEGEAENVAAEGITGAQTNMIDRGDTMAAEAEEGPWKQFLDDVTAAPYAAANRGLNFKSTAPGGPGALVGSPLAAPSTPMAMQIRAKQPVAPSIAALLSTGGQ